MTNAIETTKREMYGKLSCAKVYGDHHFEGLEDALEAHLEQLRQQYEQMAATARDRFESIQSLEQSGQDLATELKVTKQSLESLKGERDTIRNKLQAFEFANKSAGEFLIDALRKVKSQRKTIKALRKAQEARESVGATSVSSCVDVSPDTPKDKPKQHSQSCARPVDGIVYVSTTESNGVVSIYCTGCHRMTKKVDAENLEEAKKLFAESWV